MSAFDASWAANHSGIGRPRTRYEFRLNNASECKAAIRRLYAELGGNGKDAAVGATVFLISETPVGVYQVRVMARDGSTVGYFPAREASRYRVAIESIRRRFSDVTCGAAIEMNWDGSVRVVIDIGTPSECLAMFERQ